MSFVSALRRKLGVFLQVDPWRFEQGKASLERRLEQLVENDRALAQGLEALTELLQKGGHEVTPSGLYLRLSSGVQLCAVSGLTSPPTLTPTWTFPQPFILPPVVLCSVRTADGSGFFVNLTEATNTTATFKRGRIAGGGTSDPATVPLEALAVGLWLKDPA